MARPGIVLHRTHRLSAGSWLLSVCFLITAACSSSSSSKLDSGPDSVVAVGTGGRLSGTGGTAAGTGGSSGGADGSTRDAIASDTRIGDEPPVADSPGADGRVGDGPLPSDGKVADGPLTSDTRTTDAPPANPDQGQNRAPTANAGASRIVTVGATAALDGSASSDPDGDALTYAWVLLSKPAGSSATLAGASSSTASFVADKAGNYVVQLSVSDGRGGSDDASVTLTAQSPSQPVPSAYAGPDQAVTVGSKVSLDGTKSYNPTSGTMSYAWTLRSRPAGATASLSGATGGTPSFAADLKGVYVVDLTVAVGDVRSAVDTVIITAAPSGTTTVDPSAAAKIVVTDQVIQSNVEALGMNLTKIAGGTNFATNNFFYGTGFEPMVYRRIIRVERSGVDSFGQWLEWDLDGGVNSWETLGTGFGNGASVRFYRLQDATNQSLAFKDGLTDATGADHVAFLGEAKVPEPTSTLIDGGWMPSGQQRVYVDADLGLKAGDYAFLVLKRAEVPKSQMHSRVQQYYGGNFSTFSFDGDPTATLVAHPGTIPEALTMHGETCLRLTATGSGKARAFQYLFHPHDDGEGQWYSQLHPGASYRIAVWLRQEGLGDQGKVRVVFVGNGAYTGLSQTMPWTVTGDWQLYTYDFTAPAYPTSGSHSGVGIEFTGPGSLYLDNLAFFKNDAKHENKANTPHEISFDEWMATLPPTGPKPAVRFYPLSYSDSLVENLLGNVDGNGKYSVNDARFEAASGITLPAIMQWALKTGSAPGTRVVPFLTFAEEYTENEWLAIVEYLGVPYVAGTDTPTTKPYAYMRYQQRGNGTPWTDEFREIVIEYGNETWHNGAGGYGWYGFSTAGAVHQGGTEYGLFARYMFEEHVMSSALWTDNHLGDKLKLALGANYSASLEWGGSYGEAAVQKNRVTDYLGHANYVGPKWETGDSGSSIFDAHGLQETLVGMVTGMSGLIEDANALRRQLNGTTGTHYRLEAYEGGPSGYWTNEDNPEIDEQYGKSLAMGTAALDAWLYSTQNGYTHQCYLGFSSGDWWSSHTMPEAGGFRAHVGWLALKLRNLYARGNEMVAVAFDQVPRYNRTGGDSTEAIPLIASYAFQDSGATYVFVLSRKYPGNHDGVDFGTGFTPVTIHLPFATTPTAIQLYKLAHADGSAADPNESNRAAQNVVIHNSTIATTAWRQDFPIDASTGGTAAGMPPGTVFLYVFQH